MFRLDQPNVMHRADFCYSIIVAGVNTDDNMYPKAKNQYWGDH